MDDDDPYKFQEESNILDNEIYDSLVYQDIPEFLEKVGYENRKIKTNYACYEHYKHIFHYSIVKEYDIYSIFQSDSYGNNYDRYNSIIIDSNTDIERWVNYLTDLFIKSEEIICIFMDIRSIDVNSSFHTTLLIYRPHTKTIEHFDSCGVLMYGYSNILIGIINGILSEIEGSVYISSKTISSLDKYEDIQARRRGLNNICGIIGNKDFAGWCQIWSLFMYEMINRFPSISTEEIISSLYKNFKGLKFKEAGYKAYNIIRGFYRILLGRTTNIFKSEGINLNSEILEEFNPKYVLDDLKLIESLNNDMEFRIFIRESEESREESH